jgi:hypothetical protein
MGPQVEFAAAAVLLQVPNIRAAQLGLEVEACLSASLTYSPLLGWQSAGEGAWNEVFIVVSGVSVSFWLCFGVERRLAVEIAGYMHNCFNGVADLPQCQPQLQPAAGLAELRSGRTIVLGFV